MNTFKKLNGTAKATGIVVLALVMTGALALLAAEKPAAESTERGFLGVTVRSLDDAMREKLGVTHGVQVAGVEKESAAAKAGILEDDVIQSVNGEKVRDPRSLTEIVREMKPGSTARIGVWRGGKALEVKAVLGKYERPLRRTWKIGPMTKVLRSAPYLGVSILDPDEDLAAYFSLKAGEGVLVTGVEKESAAAKAGLKAGDVIVQVGDKAVRKSDDIHEALAALKEGEGVAVTVVRHGKRVTLQAKPDFDHRHRVLRFFSGDKAIELDHLELPELNIAIPDVPLPPAVPDCEDVVLRVREKLDHVHENLERVREKAGDAVIRIEEQLKKVAESYWI